LLFAPQAFSATRVTQELTRKTVVSPVLPSAFFNYDLNYSTLNARGAPALQSLGLLGELGFSNNWGVLTNSFVGRNVTGSNSLEERKWLRLESTFTKDFPNENRTLRLGDTRTRGGMLSRDVYFGGVQFGTNFALTPGFVSQPLPVLTGLSAAQSTVELYVNDVLRKVSNVPSGPFTIDNLPGLTSSGEARMVVRDIFGRESVIVQPFFTSAQLLAEGLSDWRVEAGRIRRDLGNVSNRYGPSFVNGLWRHGYSNALTLEGAAAATPRSGLINLGVSAELPLQLLGRVALGASQEQGLGSGGQWLLGVEQNGLRMRAALQAQGASVHYRQLGQDASVAPTKQQWAGNWSYSTVGNGTFGLSFANIERYDSARLLTVSANYSIRIGERSTLNLTATQASGAASGNSVGATLIIPLGSNINSSTSIASRDGKLDFSTSVARTPDHENNLGWRALVGQQQGVQREEAGVYYQGRHGQLVGDVSTSTDQTAVRLGATGSLVVADGHVFASRRLDQSFAVAEVAGQAGVGVGLGSNTLTKTDDKGVALIPMLAAYQTNSVRLNPKDLSINANVESIEQSAVPAWRSGVKVIFPVASGRGALLKIVMEDGTQAPAGAIVRIDGSKEEFYVARRGEAFVTGLQASQRLLLNWNNRRCTFEVVLPPETPDDIPRLGPLLCKGIAP
jgi:outer membrane usher protein